MPSVDIIVEKRTSDFKAYLADNNAVWEAGKSEAEAVGKLCISAKSILGLAVIRERKGRK
jgi:hypothetical protein